MDTRNLAAAKRAEALRNELAAQREDFAFETVFSRTEFWLAFLRSLQEAGYEIWVFFICTQSPVLNVARVETRVRLGGHPVPPAKVVSRFEGSIETAVKSKAFVDQLWLYDNTEVDRSHRLVGRFIRGNADFLAESIPNWMERFLLK